MYPFSPVGSNPLWAAASLFSTLLRSSLPRFTYLYVPNVIRSPPPLTWPTFLSVGWNKADHAHQQRSAFSGVTSPGSAQDRLRTGLVCCLHQFGFDGSVLLRFRVGDLALSLDYQPQSDRLHPSRRQSPPPQGAGHEGTRFVPHQPVHHPPSPCCFPAKFDAYKGNTWHWQLEPHTSRVIVEGLKRVGIELSRAVAGILNRFRYARDVILER